MIGAKKLRLRSGLMVLVGAVVAGLPPASATPVVSPEAAWTRQFGTAFADGAQAIATTSSAIYVAGHTPQDSSAGGSDAFVYKYGADGDFDWGYHFGSNAYDVATAIAATSSGIYVAGHTNGWVVEQSAGGSDAFVVKLDAEGNLQWQDQFGTFYDDYASAISVTSSSVYVGGSTAGVLPDQESAGGHDAFVREYDTAGSEVWTRQFGSEERDRVGGLAATSDGVNIAGGLGGSLLDTEYAFVSQYDSNGNPVWTHEFGIGSFASATAISATSSGIYVAGTTKRALPGQTSSGESDAFIRRYDHHGNSLWTRQFGGASTDHALGIAARPSGIYVTGETLPPGAEQHYYDVFVRRYDVGGEVVWAREFGTSSDDAGKGIAATLTGVYVAGHTGGNLAGSSTGEGGDAFVRRYVSYRPDGLISLKSSSDFAGNDVYNTTGTSQTRTTGVARGNKRTFYVRAQNDGDSIDTFKIAGCKSSDGFKVSYLEPIGTGVTRAVADGSYKMSNVEPGTFGTLRAVIEVTTSAPVGSIKKCAISLTSTNRPTRSDVVRAKVEARA